MGRSAKAQLKYADKAGARYVLVIGDDELQKREAVLKDLRGGESKSIALNAAAVYQAITQEEE